MAEGIAIITDALEQNENPTYTDVKCTAGEGVTVFFLFLLLCNG